MNNARFGQTEVEAIREDWARLTRSRRFPSTRQQADWMGAEWGCSYRTIQRIIYGEYVPRQPRPRVPRRRTPDEQ